MNNPSAEELLIAAWKLLAPNANTSRGYPRGFWPDVARVAIEMLRQGTFSPTLKFRPTTCARGSFPEEETLAPKAKAGANKASSTSAAQRAANTAALLARLTGGGA